MTADALQRWERLRADVVAGAIPVGLSIRHYPGGASYSIEWREESGDRIEVHDKWWSKNPEVWIGYQVHVEDQEGIVRRTWPVTKKRSVVVAAVREALVLHE